METDIKKYIVHTQETDWKPLTEKDVDTTGIFIKILHYNEMQKRAPSFILKFNAGAKYPYHNHPAGEELFVMQGSCVIENTLLQQGDYLYTPPGFKHAVKTDTGCELLFIVPQEVEIL